MDERERARRWRRWSVREGLGAACRFKSYNGTFKKSVVWRKEKRRENGERKFADVPHSM